MSLKVWLPLDGTLANKGASDVTITNNGATIDNEGKIGKSYYFINNAYIRISLPSDMTTILGCTVAAWIKSESSVVALGGISQDVSNYTLPCVTLYTYGWQFTSPARKGYGYVSSGVTANTNTWHHVACTVDKDGNIQTYLDGNKVASSTLTTLNVADNTTLTSSNFLEIGCDHPGGDEYFTGHINDFRVYDHALSTAEVHELSQGLILHYKFDNINNNLLNRTPKLYSSGSYNAYQLQLTENLVANQTYTLQLWNINISHSAKTADAIGLSVYWGGGSVHLATRNGTSYFSNGHSDYMNIQLTPSSSQASGSGASNAWLNIYNSTPNASGTLFMSIGAWKLEKGSITTPFSGTAAECGNVVYDSSGYNHHGTITGEITTEASVKRYDTNIHIGSTAEYIKCGAITTTGFGSTYSFSWWAKCDSFANKMHWGFSDGVRLNGIYNGNLWNTGDGSNNPLYAPGTTTQVSAPSVNEWHHFVMTCDGTSCKVYKDGVYWAISKTCKSISGTQIYINGWDTGTSYKNTDLSISDFRVYSTCLSEDDIYELYKVETKVDRSKEIHAYAFDEKGSRELIAGQIWTNSFSVHTNTPCTTIVNGEYTLTGNQSISTPYIPIAPTGHTYQYDIEISTDASNVFYIGFERYDKDKTARSNYACVYLTGMNGTPSERIHQRYRGTVDLSTDGVNPCAFIALRILNDWRSPNSRKAIIHKFSLREISTVQTPIINNTGVFDVDELDERSKASFYKNGFVEATEFIEI